MQPGVQHKDLTRGPLASVQHNGGKGSNQAGPSTNGAACIKTWLPGTQKWDVITMNFGTFLLAAPPARERPGSRLRLWQYIMPHHRCPLCSTLHTPCRVLCAVYAVCALLSAHCVACSDWDGLCLLGFVCVCVHVSKGIHDCCPGGDGRAKGINVPKADYVKNLGTIYDAAHASLAPGGKIVWVTTTPHSTTQTDCGITGTAFNSCIDDYNAAALTLLGAKPDVEVCDLNAAVVSVCGKGYGKGGCNLQRYENVHFTDAGKSFCAIEVSNVVAPLLAPKWMKLDPKVQSADTLAL
jgi:hypothetical protein